MSDHAAVSPFHAFLDHIDRRPRPRPLPRFRHVETRRLHVCGEFAEVKLERQFWPHIERLAAERKQTVNQYTTAQYTTGHGRPLTMTLRLAVLADLERRCGMGAA